jgi:hypothetical protein
VTLTQVNPTAAVGATHASPLLTIVSVITSDSTEVRISTGIPLGACTSGAPPENTGSARLRRATCEHWEHAPPARLQPVEAHLHPQ